MSTSLEIVPLDPNDRATFNAWHAAYDEADRHGRAENATLWSLEELRATMREVARRRFDLGYLGLVGNRVVTTGHLRGSLLDNLHLAEVAVSTVPGQRGHGYGSTMLAHVEHEALALGRSTITAQAAWPYEGDPQGAGESDVEFAKKRGYAIGLVDVQRQLRLPVDEALLDRLALEASAHHAAYTLRSWEGPVPEELLRGWAELTSTLMTEAPLGDMDREPETVDLEAVREGEALIATQGRSMFATVAVDGNGAVVAYSNLAISNGSGRAFQWGTLVRRADRGHRLGLAVKVANLRLLQRERPDAERIITWNAEVNEHMVGVNERLGFRAVERSGEFQKKI